MRLIGFIFAACLAFAVLRAAVAVIVLLLIGFVIVAAVRDPKQTFGCLLMFLLLGAVGQYPLVGLIIVGGLVILGLVAKWQERN